MGSCEFHQVKPVNAKGNAIEQRRWQIKTAAESTESKAHESITARKM